MDILFLIGHILLGGYFIMSGFNHFTNTEMMANYAHSRGMSGAKGLVLLSGLMLLAGGLGVVLGVYTNIALVLLLIFVVVASFQIHHFWTDHEPQQRMTEMVNFTKNLALAGALLMLFMVQTWPLTI